MLSTIAIDFDGVLHVGGTYKGDVIDGELSLEALEWIYKATMDAVVVIHSARFANSRAANRIRAFVEQSIIQYSKKTGRLIPASRLTYSHIKPPAIAFIDDRAIRFTGKWDDPSLDPQAILSMRTWEGR